MGETPDRPVRGFHDGGILAPRTGRVYPVDVDRTKWGVVCYRCGHVDEDKTRKGAIEAHYKHIDSCAAKEGRP